jgi:hypothetical protein
MALIVLNAFLFNIKLGAKNFLIIFTNGYKTHHTVGNHTTRYAYLLYNDETLTVNFRRRYPTTVLDWNLTLPTRFARVLSDDVKNALTNFSCAYIN